MVEAEGKRCLLIAGDVGDRAFCKEAVSKSINFFGKLDILVNNSAVQYPKKEIGQITVEQLERTFKTNIFSYFYMTQEILEHFKNGGIIINTTSVTAYKGSPMLLDYSSTKGAIVVFLASDDASYFSGQILHPNGGTVVNG